VLVSPSDPLPRPGRRRKLYMPRASGKLSLGLHAGELQESKRKSPRGCAASSWLHGSPCQHYVNMASPHPQGLLPLRVAQASRQKRPLLAAKGHVRAGGHILGRRRECRRPGWRWLVAGWWWWPWQARCILEGVLEGCRDRHAVVLCKALLTGIHLMSKTRGCCASLRPACFLPEIRRRGSPRYVDSGHYVEATLGPPRPVAPGQSACASRPHLGLALDIGLHPRERWPTRYTAAAHQVLLPPRPRHLGAVVHQGQQPQAGQRRGLHSQ
jgi:hypothetical protein